MIVNFLRLNFLNFLRVNERVVEPVETSLNLCLEKHRQLDAFAVDHLLWKLNSNKCKIYTCTLPINRAGLPYFAKHLNTNDEQQLICIHSAMVLISGDV